VRSQPALTTNVKGTTMTSTAATADTPTAPSAQQQRPRYGVLLTQHLARAKKGTTPEELICDLAEAVRDDLFAARGLIAGIEHEELEDGIRAGLCHVVERSTAAAQDLLEILQCEVQLLAERERQPHV
jgi:hypothetical protein